MATINLYNISDEMNRVRKNVSGTKVAELSCHYKEPCSIEDPVVTLKRTNLNFNYAYLPELGRYYFVQDIQLMPGGIMEISLHVDVLMSFQNNIANSLLIAERSTNHPNMEIEDPYVRSQKTVKREVRKIADSPFSGRTYILMIGGK